MSCGRRFLAFCLFLVAALAAAADDPHGDPLPDGVRQRLGTVRFRHGKPVVSVAFSPDSKTIASGSQDTLIRLWDAATGKELRQLQGHDGEVSCVCFSPDGKRLASAGKDHIVRVWDPASGKEVSTIKGFPQANFTKVLGLAFSPDGKRLAASCGEDWVGLWEVGGKPVRMLAEQRGSDLYVMDWSASLAFTPDGKTLCSGGKTVRAWDLDTGRKRRQWPGFEYGARIALSPDGTTLAVRGYGPLIQLWDVNTGKKGRLIQGVELGVGIAFSPDGKMLAESGFTGVALWEVATGKLLRRLPQPGGVQSLAIAPDGTKLAAGGDHAVHVWDLRTGKEIGPADEPSDAVSALAFAPHGRTLAAAWDQTIFLGDPAKGMRRLTEQDDSVSCLALAPDGKVLASGGDTGTVYLWDTAAGTELRQFIEHDERILALLFTPDGKHLLAAGADHVICMWDTQTGKRLAYFKDDKKQRNGNIGEAQLPVMALAPDGRTVALGDPEQAVRILDLKGNVLRKLKRPKEKEEPGNEVNLASLAFAPDGRTLAVAAHDRSVRLWDIATGKLLRTWTDTAPKEDDANQGIARRFLVTFSPDGRTLATWHADPVQRIYIWNDTGRKPDGRVRLWETATGKERRQLLGHRGNLTTLAFAADGITLATGSDDTSILLWDLPGPRGGVARVLAPQELENLWTDLAGEDAAKAYRAIMLLAQSPQEAVSFLAERLKPAEGIEAKRLAQLIADLDSDKFAARKKASDELEKLGELAEGPLQQALKGDPSPELKKGIDQLLARIEGNRQALSGERLRTVRTLEALEFMGTPEARRALSRLVDGAADGWQTREARAILARLERRSEAP